MTVFKRKKLNLGVKSYFQRWLLIRILGMVILSSLIAAIILYFYARQELTASFFDAHIKLRRVSDILLPVIVAGSAVSLISGTLLALFLPQKIAGPIFRIEQDIKPVQNGDFTSLISLREEDVLKDLASEINKITTETRSRVQKSKNALTALIAAMGDTAEEPDVTEHLRVLQTSLNQFKTK